MNVLIDTNVRPEMRRPRRRGWPGSTGLTRAGPLSGRLDWPTLSPDAVDAEGRAPLFPMAAILAAACFAVRILPNDSTVAERWGELRRKRSKFGVRNQPDGRVFRWR